MRVTLVLFCATVKPGAMVVPKAPLREVKVMTTKLSPTTGT